MGAVALAAGVILSKKHTSEEICFPEFCGTCGDDDILRTECNCGMDSNIILHKRTGV